MIIRDRYIQRIMTASAVIGKYSCLHKCRPMRITIKQAEQSCTRLLG